MGGIDHGLGMGGAGGMHREFGSTSSSSSSSSSIGKNSDDEGGEKEVESAYKGPLDMIECLEEVLPIRRGISEFYNGKSKSFTSLTESSSLPMKNLGRPENACSRRRRNLLTHRMCARGGISKKPFKTPREREGKSSSSPTHKHLQSRQTKGSLGNCVPVVDSPPCLARNIHNIIC